MNIIPCDESYAGQILAIFNEAIVNSTALYDYRPRTPESMAGWFDAKRKGNFPVLAAVAENGELLGFASYGVFGRGRHTSTRWSIRFTWQPGTAAKESASDY